MSELTTARFDDYFYAVHGYKPYPWQSRLTQQVLDGDGWPDVIDLPTGTGKTAVLDTAIFALAVKPEVSPRRIVFVIDRRIVVDQVYERARAINTRITSARDGVLADIKRSLKELTGDEELLGVAALRGGQGGIPLDAEWARRPEQPWVMVSTVDQFGSRLLFRGYGASPRTRPILAGLAGNDCLVILDEVHLSRAFADTLRDATSDGEIPQMCSVNPKLLPRRFKIVEMSATPGNSDAGRFALTDSDLEKSPLLRRIAAAPKHASLVTISGNRPLHESVPKKVLELIKKELRTDEQSVGVIVNRVQTARETHKLLQQHGFATHLLTGRMRPIDKEQVLREISDCVNPDRQSPPKERTVVVATQAIEVGADFSFDALISEAAPIDSLCQRLGRLDRRGTLASQRQQPARCWILGVASEMKPNRPDPIYKEATRHTWDELQELVNEGAIDLGPSNGIVRRLNPKARAPKPEAPLLLPNHVAAWSQTNPQPVIDPPRAEFLHGKDTEREPDVSVVWRRDRSKEALDLVPLRPAEFLAVPVSAVRSWIRGTVESPISDTDTDSSWDDAQPAVQSDNELIKRRLSNLCRWVSKEGSPIEKIRQVADIKPGDVLIVDPAMGGLFAATWDPSARPGTNSDNAPALQIEDLGDQAQVAYGRRATLRLDPILIRMLQLPQESAPPSPQDEQDASTSKREAVESWLRGLLDLPPGTVPDWFSEVIERLNDTGFAIETVGSDTASAYYVLVERAVDPGILDESEDKPSLTGAATKLRDHLSSVGDKAATYGHRLGLSADLIDDLRLAGELHDLGKVDSRFQAQMHGHDPVLMAAADAALAKSVPGARLRRNGWPPVRHEISSVALIQSSAAILELAHDSDLVLHLVGTHHGYGRPLPPIKEDSSSPEWLKAEGRLHGHGFRLGTDEDNRSDTSDQVSPSVNLGIWSDLAETPLALEMADRFWKLQQRYGHHGLAWLEAIFRLADWQQSAEEARNGSEEI